MKKMRVLLILCAFTLSMTACTKKEGASIGAPPAAPGDEILVGEVGSLTGNEATFGTSTRDGIDLAVSQLNAAGGINGKKLRVLVLDDAGKPEEAATDTTRLVTQDKVVAVLGEEASTRTLAMAPIAQTYKVPLITPSSVNPEITKKGDYIFRVCFVDSFMGMVMAKFAVATLHAKKAAILRDIKNDYSVSLAKVFTENFTRLGGTVVGDESYGAGDQDFKSQLTALKSRAPDVIYVPGYYTDVGLIARQELELGLKATLLGGDGWDSPKLVEIGGAALEGSYFATHYTPDDKNPKVQGFIADYGKAYGGVVPDSLAATGFDAMMVLADALKRSKSLAPSDVRDAIAATKDYAGVTGRITIDKDRNARKPAVVVGVKGGKIVYKETIDPT